MTSHKVEHIPCGHVISSVWDYLDDEIDADRKEQIRRHLEACDHCRDQYTFEGAFLRSVSRILNDETDYAALRHRVETALIKHGFSRAR